MHLQWIKDNSEVFEQLIKWIKHVENTARDYHQPPEYEEARFFLTAVIVSIHARREDFFNPSGQLDDGVVQLMTSLRQVSQVPKPKELQSFLENNTNFQHLPPSYHTIFTLKNELLEDIKTYQLSLTLIHLIAVNHPNLASENLVKIENLLNAHPTLNLHQRPLDNLSMRPLMIAAQYNNGPLIQLLLAWGADPNATDAFGRTALVMARQQAETQWNEETMVLLEEAQELANSQHEAETTWCWCDEPVLLDQTNPIDNLYLASEKNTPEKTLAFYRDFIAAKLSNQESLMAQYTENSPDPSTKNKTITQTFKF